MPSRTFPGQDPSNDGIAMGKRKLCGALSSGAGE